MKSHAAIIIKGEVKMLFIQRAESKSTLPNIWGVPTGTVENGESPMETARREAMEELGLTVEPESVFAEIAIPEFNAMLHFVSCRVIDGFPAIREPHEIRSLRWMTLQEFYAEYGDDKIGHGMAYLRNRKEIWEQCLAGTVVCE